MPYLEVVLILPLSIQLMTLLVDEEGFLVINEDTIMFVSIIAYTIVALLS